MSAWFEGSFKKPRLFSARILLVLVVGAASLALVFCGLGGSPNGGLSRVSQMEESISRLRDNNSSANLKIDAIVTNYFHVGDDLVDAEGELRRAGYAVRHIMEAQKELVVAEKKSADISLLRPLSAIKLGSFFR